ncbi:MAG: 50S ribosomal protein L9 [Anaerolineaceae bacterium]|nr:50S ribosomal protein L9 [Anaerolineaceae bacterium]NTV36096.1 50S ribosomal protein L9 [Anaerolineaceae bacterium]
MKVLLIKDVYKLGHAGDVKKVADGFGRNYLLPQGMAILATPGALKQVEHIRAKANTNRSVLNSEMSGISEKVNGLLVSFASKAGETGKLYGSITSQMIIDVVNQKLGLKLDRRQVEVQPIRTLGEFKAQIRLTVDLVPEIKVLVYREGEMPAQLVEAAKAEQAAKAEKAAPVEEEKKEEAAPEA